MDDSGNIEKKVNIKNLDELKRICGISYRDTNWKKLNTFNIICYNLSNNHKNL